MPTEFFALLLGPFGQSRHGCDPPDQLIPFSSLPSAFDGAPSSFAHRSAFFPFSFILQQIQGIEPLLNPFRHTVVTQQKYCDPPNIVFETERTK